MVWAIGINAQAPREGRKPPFAPDNPQVVSDFTSEGAVAEMLMGEAGRALEAQRRRKREAAWVERDEGGSSKEWRCEQRPRLGAYHFCR